MTTTDEKIRALIVRLGADVAEAVLEDDEDFAGYVSDIVVLLRDIIEH